MNDHPWRGIQPPGKTSQYSARRIPGVGSQEWGLYWAVDSHRDLLLILQHTSSCRLSHRPPKLKGLRVEIQLTEGQSGRLVVVRLTDGDQRDIFCRLCEDIVESTRSAKSESEAVNRLIVRTWRWHRLLRGGGQGLLNPAEQKGLIGELWVLETHLFPAIDTGDAVRGWVGPLGEPKDFRVGTIGVEAKACTPLASTLHISSPEQLDSTDALRVFLHVTKVAPALEHAPLAFTVTEMAARIQQIIVDDDPSAEKDFEERLLATGFDWTDDYADRRWLIEGESLFEVGEGFPRITPGTVPAGVQDVRYVIALAQCEGFRVVESALVDAISGGA